MVHSQTRQLGENLHWASARKWSDGRVQRQQVTPTQVTDSWGAEKADYNYAANSCADGEMCGHYTQMVWKSSTEMGCGMAFCSDDSQVWVCNYRPPGNYAGRKPYCRHGSKIGNRVSKWPAGDIVGLGCFVER